MKTPQLRRDIQLVSTMVEGQQVIMFVDPLRLAENSFAVDTKLLPLLELINGGHDMRDIQVAMIRQQGGRLVPLSEIEAFVEKLDKNFLLNSDLFREKVRISYEEFNRQSDRYPSHIGNAYESDPEKLSQFINDIEEKLPQDDLDYSNKNITGILAPHLDIKVAKTTYVNLYRRLKGRNYNLVIILGVNHQWQDGLYSVSEKNFITPFGKLKTDKDFISQLKARVPEGALTTNDFGHKIEHSIEFQTIFLHHYLKGPVSIVPVLCGGVHEFIFQRKNIFADDRFLGMAEALEDLIKARGENVLLVSGVDFSHVGLKFGHQMPAENILPLAKSNDQKIISLLLRGKPESIFEGAIETQDQFHVCGLPSILLFSRLLRESRAELLAHETYDERATKSAVTYASMIFTGS